MTIKYEIEVKMLTKFKNWLKDIKKKIRKHIIY